jgi:hypothetical protein
MKSQAAGTAHTLDACKLTGNSPLCTNTKYFGLVHCNLMRRGCEMTAGRGPSPMGDVLHSESSEREA